MKNSAIQWCDHTFNPWIGCTKVAPECKHCYAETMALRYRWSEWGKGKERHRTSHLNWQQPLRWNARCEKLGIRERVFCASLADVFDEEVDVNWRLDLFSLILKTSSLDWLLLTKRPAAAKRFLKYGDQPLENVWLGASAGVDPEPLLEIPATIHFLSCEPMLKPIEEIDSRFDWVIFGGESGRHARQCHIDWIRNGVQICRRANITPFVKQLGTRPTFSLTQDAEWLRKLADYHGGNPEEWPEDLRVREFPNVAIPA